MSIESKVFEKLFTTDKVELASQKIELSNLQDLNRIISDGKSILTRGTDFINKKNSLQKEGKSLNTDAKSLLVGGEKLINEFVNSARELGIDVKSVKEVDLAINALGAIDTIVKQSQPF
jgi:hypothetical protein